MFEIEKNVPLTKSYRGLLNPMNLPLISMEIGDSFNIPLSATKFESLTGLGAHVRSTVSRLIELGELNESFSVTTANTSTKDSPSLRVWRTNESNHGKNQ